MSFLDKVKSLFPKLDSFIKVNLTFNNNSNNKTEYNDSSKKLDINLSQIQPKDKKQLIESALSDGYLLLRDDSEKLIEEFKSNELQSDVQEELDFIKANIPQEDLNIWRAALYIKKCFAERKKVDNLKADISYKYGHRGRNIANLCSAGYLKDWFIPLYEEFKKASQDENDAKEKFNKVYTKIVDELPFTIFVSAEKNEDQLKQEIIAKVNTSSKIGIKFVNIHGIGSRNIKVSRTAVEMAEKEIKNIVKTVNEEAQMVFIRLEIKK